MATEAVTNIELGLTRAEFGDTRRAVLVLRTDKHSCKTGVLSYAYVRWISATGNHHADGLATGTGDYEKIPQFRGMARVTQKAIDTQHKAIFTPEVIESLTNDAKNWYATADARRRARSAAGSSHSRT